MGALFRLRCPEGNPPDRGGDRHAMRDEPGCAVGAASGGAGAGTTGRKMPPSMPATEFLSPWQSGPGMVPPPMNESSTSEVAAWIAEARGQKNLSQARLLKQSGAAVSE